MAEQIKTALTILRRRQVEKRVGLTRSPLYARIKAKTFPAPVKLGNGRAVGWLEHEVDEWLTAQAANREGVNATEPDAPVVKDSLAAMMTPTAEKGGA